MEIRGDGAAMTLYEAVGGDAFFVELVDRFYDIVEHDERIRAVHLLAVVVQRDRNDRRSAGAGGLALACELLAGAITGNGPTGVIPIQFPAAF